MQENIQIWVSFQVLLGSRQRACLLKSFQVYLRGFPFDILQNLDSEMLNSQRASLGDSCSPAQCPVMHPEGAKPSGEGES